MRVIGLCMTAALLLGACATAAPAPQGVAGTPAQAASGAPATAAASSTAPASALLTMSLTDVRSGERFTLSDFKGKVTIVEGMAVW